MSKVIRVKINQKCLDTLNKRLKKEKDGENEGKGDKDKE